jgi:hypothetical protein
MADLNGVVVIQHDGARRRFGRNARRARVAEGEGARAGLDEQRVGVAVIAALELDDELPAGEAACEPERGHGGLGAGGDEAHELERGHEAAEELGELHLGFGWRAEGERARSGFLHRFDDRRMAVAGEHRAP